MGNFVREFDKWYEKLNDEQINKYFMGFTQTAAEFVWKEAKTNAYVECMEIISTSTDKQDILFAIAELIKTT